MLWDWEEQKEHGQAIFKTYGRNKDWKDLDLKFDNVPFIHSSSLCGPYNLAGHRR